MWIFTNINIMHGIFRRDRSFYQNVTYVFCKGPRIVLHVVKLTGWFIVMYSRLWSRLIGSNWSNRSDCVLPVSDQIMLLLNVNLLMYAPLQTVVNVIQSSSTPTSLRVQMGQVMFQLAVPLAAVVTPWQMDTVGDRTVALNIIARCSITQTPTGQSKVWWLHARKMVVI